MKNRSIWSSPLAVALVITLGYAVAPAVAQLGTRVTQPINIINAAGYKVKGVAGVGARMHANPADQTGNATNTLKMNGLGAAAAACVITPTSSGNVTFTISGLLTQSTTAQGVTWALARGTGTPPANAAAASGTIISATPIWTALTGMLTVPFSVTSSSTGLSVGVAQWFDLQVADVTGGTATITKVDCTALEN